MESFWNKLPRPFFASAPMADVTDAAFRGLLVRYGKPDVIWTEFVSADGLYHTGEVQRIPDAENPLIRDLQFSAEEHPIVAQIFSSKPEMIAYATKLVAELGFDGVDLNMGCPDKSIEKQEAGAALIKNPKHAAALIRAAQEAWRASVPNPAYRTKLVRMPVSVKTRVGYSKESLDEWLPVLLEAEPAAITLHLRTRKQMSKAPADWELMKKAVSIRNRVNPRVLLIGNGDVRGLEDARMKAEESGCDGVMLGRALFGNPWLFEGIAGHRMSSREVGHAMSEHRLEEKLRALGELAHGFESLSPPKHFDVLKKHIKAFVSGFDGAADMRATLMRSVCADELIAAIDALRVKL
ncbi:tRNA-dihydrouridine synthase family protein [Candidatus Kaiserbacteria bacterium]|nr:tRNA-dihydrouridine synthase family protein [Candidatus Kaiserbacteria bacterium]